MSVIGDGNNTKPDVDLKKLQESLLAEEKSSASSAAPKTTQKANPSSSKAPKSTADDYDDDYLDDDDLEIENDVKSDLSVESYSKEDFVNDYVKVISHLVQDDSYNQLFSDYKPRFVYDVIFKLSEMSDDNNKPKKYADMKFERINKRDISKISTLIYNTYCIAK